MTGGRTQSPDAGRSSWWSGTVAMVALVVVAFASLYQQRPRLGLGDPSTGASYGPATRLPTPTADPTDLPGFRSDAFYLPDEELLGFVEIPAGPFLMGSDPAVDSLAFDIERWSPAAVIGRVELPTFFAGRFEVTVAQFRAFVAATGLVVDPLALRGEGDHPVAVVSWPDALAYTRWLHGVLRDSPDTPPRLSELLAQGWRVTLPTEAQWEKAARSDDGRVFPWGDTPMPDRANYVAAGVAPVGSIDCPECPHGLADMSGNVWEWTRSPYQPYPYDPLDDREGLDADALWVMRGGSFADGAQNVRAAVRGGADPGARRPFIGFRVVISPPRT